MKRNLVLIILLFSICFVILTYCAQPSKGSRKPVTSIQFQPSSKNFKVGDKITVALKTKVKDGSLEKIELLMNDKTIFSSKNTENSFVIETADLNVGNHFLKVIATKADGQIGENYADFLLLSDVVPVKYGYKVINVFPHDPKHFTQGLEIHEGYMYEGTGQQGQSAIYKKDMKNWTIVKEHKIDDQHFGEGITILNGKLYQLTYQSRIGFIYDVNTFDLLKTWTFKSPEGWGITNDGTYLIMSDGTENLTFIDPQTFKVIKKIQACNNESVIKSLNELEYINGEIWANIWITDKIVRIDPETGKIKGEIDMKGILGSYFKSRNPEEDVLNGIAFDRVKNKIYVTGKLWPKMFEIQLIPK